MLLTRVCVDCLEMMEKKCFINHFEHDERLCIMIRQQGHAVAFSWGIPNLPSKIRLPSTAYTIPIYVPRQIGLSTSCETVRYHITSPHSDQPYIMQKYGETMKTRFHHESKMRLIKPNPTPLNGKAMKPTRNAKKMKEGVPVRDRK